MAIMSEVMSCRGVVLLPNCDGGGGGGGGGALTITGPLPELEGIGTGTEIGIGIEITVLWLCGGAARCLMYPCMGQLGDGNG